MAQSTSGSSSETSSESCQESTQRNYSIGFFIGLFKCFQSTGPFVSLAVVNTTKTISHIVLLLSFVHQLQKFSESAIRTRNMRSLNHMDMLALTAKQSQSSFVGISVLYNPMRQQPGSSLLSSHFFCFYPETKMFQVPRRASLGSQNSETTVAMDALRPMADGVLRLCELCVLIVLVFWMAKWWSSSRPGCEATWRPRKPNMVFAKLGSELEFQISECSKLHEDSPPKIPKSGILLGARTSSRLNFLVLLYFFHFFTTQEQWLGFRQRSGLPVVKTYNWDWNC